jgi:Nucleotide-sugar transporter
MRSVRRGDSARERKRAAVAHSSDDSDPESDIHSTNSAPGLLFGSTMTVAPRGKSHEESPGSASKQHNPHAPHSGSHSTSLSHYSGSKKTILHTLSGPLSMLLSIKFLVLVILSLQNSLFTVLRRYSQGVLKEVYSKYEVLMVGEIIKMIVSAYMIHRQMDEAAAAGVSSNSSSSSSSVPFASSEDGGQIAATRPPQHNIDLLWQRLRFLIRHSGKMAGLALIYGAMNILSFVALRNIGAGLFTIFAQCKIFTTALFSALLLNRKYSGNQWRALAALILGVLLFSESVWGDSNNLFKDSHDANTALGVAAVVTEVTLSGFASIYFEKVIKTDPMQLSIWERNFQLALVRWSGFGRAKKCGLYLSRCILTSGLLVPSTFVHCQWRSLVYAGQHPGILGFHGVEWRRNRRVL